jgi:glycerophosphoryl diester phosphodiesterase
MTRPLVLLIAALVAGCASTFDLQGHRGARGLAPENTLPAFRKALEIGVTTLELDTNVTRDGIVVVGHDTALNPDIARLDGRWLAARGPALHDLTFAQLQRYDIGRIDPASAYAKRFPGQVPADGTHYSRLADLFAMVRELGRDDVRFNIETKISPLAPEESLAPEPFARLLIAEIRAAGMQRRATIQSFDWRTLQVVQREAPGIETVYLSVRQKFMDTICTGAQAGSPQLAPAACGESPWTAGFQLRDHGSVARMVKAAGGHVWSPEFRDIDASALEEAHRLGLRVVVWTVNDPGAIARLLAMGVDGIISDRPDVVREEMRKRGMALPRAQGSGQAPPL